jgi:YVTN family beta-propeller protein
MRTFDALRGVVGRFAVLVAAVAVAACCVGVSSAAAARVIGTIHVGTFPRGVSSDGSHVWVANYGGEAVSEIEASSGTVIRTIKVGSYPVGVSSDGTHVWVANSGEEGTVSEIEASSGTVIRTIHVGSFPFAVSSDGTHVWVTNLGEEGTVSEIEASSGTVIRTIPVGKEPDGVSSDGTHVWVTNLFDETVSEILANGFECTGNSGTIKLSPGLTNMPVYQGVKVKGTLKGCVTEPFTEAKYTATLTSAGKVGCSALKELGKAAFGTAKYTWTPKAKTTTGIFSIPLSETAGISFSSELEAGPYSPLTLEGLVSESYTNAAKCGTTAVTKGKFTGPAVNIE